MSSSVSSTTNTSSTIRLTGMASGLDVDSLVKQMMVPYNAQVDKLKQERTLTQWKQDSYRDSLGDFNTFKSTYFDVLKPDTNMLSSNSYAGFDVTSADSGSATAVSKATATAGTGAIIGTYVVSNVVLATKATKSSVVTNITQGDSAVSSFDFRSGTTGINVKINGVNNLLTIDASNFGNLDSLIANINDKITAIGSPLKETLIAQKSSDGTKIQFAAKTNDSINISDVSGGNTLSKLGYSSASFDINQSISDKVSNIFSGTTAAFSIQSDSGTAVDFSYDFSSTGIQSGWTISQVLSDISSKAGVSAIYNQLSRTFSLSSSKTGSAESINVTKDKDGFMNTMFGTTAGTAFYGTDASAKITNPQGISATVIKSSNNFTIDGVSYSLLKNNTATDTTSTNITITSNVQKTYDKIKDIIDKYNTMIDKISTKLNEKKQSGYSPLTDDQKTAMSEDQITAWEAKAKLGLLTNDSNLQSMLTSMRNAFFAEVTGAGISLSSIGLSTSSDYTKGGKIIIDEAKLKDAISSKPTEVTNLFMQKSTSQPVYSTTLTDFQRSNRNSSEGIFQRINDILQDYTRTTRDTNGKKGLLVEKAGIKGDYSEYNNFLYTQLTADDKKIADLKSKLADRQQAYYTKFSKLETAMNTLNNQSSYLTQQLSSM